MSATSRRCLIAVLMACALAPAHADDSEKRRLTIAVDTQAAVPPPSPGPSATAPAPVLAFDCGATCGASYALLPSAQSCPADQSPSIAGYGSDGVALPWYTYTDLGVHDGNRCCCVWAHHQLDEAKPQPSSNGNVSTFKPQYSPAPASDGGSSSLSCCSAFKCPAAGLCVPPPCRPC